MFPRAKPNDTDLTGLAGVYTKYFSPIVLCQISDSFKKGSKERRGVKLLEQSPGFPRGKAQLLTQSHSCSNRCADSVGQRGTELLSEIPDRRAGESTVPLPSCSHRCRKGVKSRGGPRSRLGGCYPMPWRRRRELGERCARRSRATGPLCKASSLRSKGWWRGRTSSRWVLGSFSARPNMRFELVFITIILTRLQSVILNSNTQPSQRCVNWEFWLLELRECKVASTWDMVYCALQEFVSKKPNLLFKRIMTFKIRTWENLFKNTSNKNIYILGSILCAYQYET